MQALEMDLNSGIQEKMRIFANKPQLDQQLLAEWRESSIIVILICL